MRSHFRCSNCQSASPYTGDEGSSGQGKCLRCGAAVTLASRGGSSEEAAAMRAVAESTSASRRLRFLQNRAQVVAPCVGVHFDSPEFRAAVMASVHGLFADYPLGRSGSMYPPPSVPPTHEPALRP